MVKYPGTISELNRLTQELIVHRGMVCDNIEVIAAVYKVSLYLIDSKRSILHAYRPELSPGTSSMFASLVAVMYNNHLYNVEETTMYRALRVEPISFYVQYTNNRTLSLGNFPYMILF